MKFYTNFPEDEVEAPRPEKFDSTMKFVEKEISRPKEKKYLEKGNAFYRHAMHLSNGMMGGRTLDRQGQQVLGEDNCDVDIMCDSSTLEVN